MSDIFNGIVEKNPKEDLCIVYVLYFDEKKGQIPLLMYPDDNLRNDKRYMRPINYHPVWFLETEELDHIDLEYKGYTFFGKKIQTTSKRKKRRAGLEEKTPETIVIIVSLPSELDIFGDELVKRLTDDIRNEFEDKLYEVIESEIASDTVIKTQKIQESISEGKKIKVFMRQLIDKTIKNYFSRVIEGKSESPSLKTQKAISYFSLKGFEFSPLSNLKGDSGLTSIEFFDKTQKATDRFTTKPTLIVTNLSFIENSQEIEITVQNNTLQELKNLFIVITHVKEFFEKEVMNQEIDLWFPQEELLFVSPIVPHIDEYLLSIKIEDESGISQNILIQRIDLNQINKITS
ncbi:MAG: hypothetical protein JSV62_12900 [Promethearchaeota archaeon]|nr:MAG: hypothetical protein JSV62_12900 [Candidatus Lokiarchaeota archaeon]